MHFYIKAVVLAKDEEFPLSIYLALQQGEFADLEVVSEASIHLIRAMKDVVAFIDPGVEVRVVVRNGKESSLRLNSLTKFVTGGTGSSDETKAHRRGLAIGCILSGILGWLPGEIASHYLEQALNALDEKVLEVLKDEATEEQISGMQKMCREVVVGVTHNGDASKHVQKFYSSLQKDEVIVGVGLGTDHDAPPDFIIPRDQFAIRARGEIDDVEPDQRERVERMDLVLLQPRLTADKRAWRFSANGFEFGAKVLDDQFLSQTLSGQREIPLREGVVLDADVALHEVRAGEIWVVKSRSVLVVHDVRSGPIQASFL